MVNAIFLHTATIQPRRKQKHPHLQHTPLCEQEKTEASTRTDNTIVASRPFSTAEKSSKAETVVSRPCTTSTLQDATKSGFNATVALKDVLAGFTTLLRFRAGMLCRHSQKMKASGSLSFLLINEFLHFFC